MNPSCLRAVSHCTCNNTLTKAVVSREDPPASTVRNLTYGWWRAAALPRDDIHGDRILQSRARGLRCGPPTRTVEDTEETVTQPLRHGGPRQDWHPAYGHPEIRMLRPHDDESPMALASRSARGRQRNSSDGPTNPSLDRGCESRCEDCGPGAGHYRDCSGRAAGRKAAPRSAPGQRAPHRCDGR